MKEFIQELKLGVLLIGGCAAFAAAVVFTCYVAALLLEACGL